MVAFTWRTGLTFYFVCTVLLGVGPAFSLSPSTALAQTPAVGSGATAAQDVPSAASPILSDAETERFLLKAKIIRTTGAGKGVTGSMRATLSDGTLTHDVHIQTVDEHKREFRGSQGTEFDFRDSWTFNVAAYKLDRLLGLNMVPVSVSRSYRSSPAAVTWWVDDVMMDEGTRVKKNARPPHDKVASWTQQLQMMRLFDQLIHNTDRNMGNMLIGHDWRLWAIDHTRAFRKNTKLLSPAQVVRCDREVFERLKALEITVLRRELGRYLDGAQVRAILTRRDAIVDKIESLGPAALFDRDTAPARTDVTFHR